MKQLFSKQWQKSKKSDIVWHFCNVWPNTIQLDSYISFHIQSIVFHMSWSLYIYERMRREEQIFYQYNENSFDLLKNPQGSREYSLRTTLLTSKSFHALYSRFQIQDESGSRNRLFTHPSCQSNNAVPSFRIILFTGP